MCVSEKCSPWEFLIDPWTPVRRTASSRLCYRLFCYWLWLLHWLLHCLHLLFCLLLCPLFCLLFYSLFCLLFSLFYLFYCLFYNRSRSRRHHPPNNTDDVRQDL